jgi:hypothetical protein
MPRPRCPGRSSLACADRSTRFRASSAALCSPAGRSCASPQFRGHVGRPFSLSRNLHGTLSPVSKQPGEHRQVSGCRACIWMAVCKPSAQPTLVRTQHLPLGETPAQGRYGIPDSFPGQAARCRRTPLFAAGRGIYAGWPGAGLSHIWPGVSAPGSALGDPPGAHAGPRLAGCTDQRSSSGHWPGTPREPSSSLGIVQLAATVSRSSFGRRTRSATPTIDPVTTHTGSGACGEDGRGRWPMPSQAGAKVRHQMPRHGAILW